MRLQSLTIDIGSAEHQAVALPQCADSQHWEFLPPILFSWVQQDFRPGRRDECMAE